MLRYSTGIICMLLLASMAHAQQPAAPAAPMPSMPAMPGTPTVIAPALPTPVEPAAQLPEVDVPSVALPAAVPEVDVPQLAVPVAEKPTAPQAPSIDASTYIPDPNEIYSYGASDISLLFTPAQTKRMKSVLSAYEAARRNRGPSTIEVVEEPTAVAAEEPKEIVEPTNYPVFTLKSIAYRNPSDWTVWIGDLRITPKKNNNEVRVLAVSPNRAQFVWKPEYATLIQVRSGMKRFASTDKVRHKMTRPNTAIFDAAAAQATFTLLPNQSFAPGYMATFEGKIASPALEPIKDDEEGDMIDEAAAAIKAALPTDTSAENPENLDALLKSQQQKGPVRSLFQRSLQDNPKAYEPAN